VPDDQDAGLEGEVQARDRFVLVTEPATTPFDVRRHEVVTASVIAYGLLVIFGVSAVGLVGFSFVNAQDAMDVAKVVLPFSVAPLATALGYYFGRATR